MGAPRKKGCLGQSGNLCHSQYPLRTSRTLSVLGQMTKMQTSTCKLPHLSSRWTLRTPTKPHHLAQKNSLDLPTTRYPRRNQADPGKRVVAKNIEHPAEPTKICAQKGPSKTKSSSNDATGAKTDGKAERAKKTTTGGKIGGKNKSKNTKKEKKDDDASENEFFTFTPGIDQSLPALSDIQDIFNDITSRAYESGFNEAVDLLDGRVINVATICSGTESPLLALDMICDGKLDEPTLAKHGLMIYSLEANIQEGATVQTPFQCRDRAFQTSLHRAEFRACHSVSRHAGNS